MKSAKVDAKGFTTWLWLSTYGKSKYNLPKNFCDFFWTSVLSYIIAIFAWPGHLFNAINKDTTWTKAWAWIFHIPAAYIFYGMFNEGKNLHLDFMTYIWGVLLLIGTIAVMIVVALIVAGVIALKDWIKDNLRERRREKMRKILQEKGTMSASELVDEYEESREWGVITWWKAFKGKYCPKIEWQNLEKEEPRDRGFDFVGEPIEDDYDEAYNHN